MVKKCDFRKIDELNMSWSSFFLQIIKKKLEIERDNDEVMSIKN